MTFMSQRFQSDALLHSSGRYVILYHQMPAAADRRSHWDLMFEVSTGLRTWAIETQPKPGLQAAAMALPVHRLEYLDYEGPVSRNRGVVKRIDSGTYLTGTVDAAVWKIQLKGRLLRCRLTLQEVEHHQGVWHFCFSDEG